MTALRKRLDTMVLSNVVEVVFMKGIGTGTPYPCGLTGFTRAGTGAEPAGKTRTQPPRVQILSSVLTVSPNKWYIPDVLIEAQVPSQFGNDWITFAQILQFCLSLCIFTHLWRLVVMAYMSMWGPRHTSQEYSIKISAPENKNWAHTSKNTQTWVELLNLDKCDPIITELGRALRLDEHVRNIPLVRRYGDSRTLSKWSIATQIHPKLRIELLVFVLQHVNRSITEFDEEREALKVAGTSLDSVPCLEAFGQVLKWYERQEVTIWKASQNQPKNEAAHVLEPTHG
ncbi:hypothetical protein C8F01DRAFT_1345440 [Mycena amicta]|nr:hypothetical protein C8F01DRAFT_1345440 [Mycena amicta]